MGFAPATKKLLERVYQFLTPLLLGLGVYIVFKQGKQIEAVLLLLIGCAAIFYYWIKFFKLPASEADDVWPPFVSTCPDYLTLVGPQATGLANPVCMDFVGVSLNGGLQKVDPRKVPQAVSAHQYFDLKSASANPLADDRTVEMCAQVKTMGLTWAHICETNKAS